MYLSLSNTLLLLNGEPRYVQQPEYEDCFSKTNDSFSGGHEKFVEKARGEVESELKEIEDRDVGRHYPVDVARCEVRMGAIAVGK